MEKGKTKSEKQRGLLAMPLMMAKQQRLAPILAEVQGKFFPDASDSAIQICTYIDQPDYAAYDVFGTIYGA
ncbi:MAG: hypothetical protein ACLTLQ_15960 [[Clostridium] scindens]